MPAARTTSRPQSLAPQERLIAFACAAAAMVTVLLIVFGTRVGPVIVPMANGRGMHAGDLAATPFVWLAYRLWCVAARGR